MEKFKKIPKKTMAFTCGIDILQKIDALPRTIAPSKSVFVERALRAYFKQIEAGGMSAVLKS